MVTGYSREASLIIADEKISGYILAHDHPTGAGKAAFFLRFGFRRSRPQELVWALKRHARSAAVIAATQTPFGLKYALDGKLLAPDGRQPIVRAIWFCRGKDDTLHFVTAYPA